MLPQGIAEFKEIASIMLQVRKRLFVLIFLILARYEGCFMSPSGHFAEASQSPLLVRATSSRKVLVESLKILLTSILLVRASTNKNTESFSQEHTNVYLDPSRILVFQLPKERIFSLFNDLLSRHVLLHPSS